MPATREETDPIVLDDITVSSQISPNLLVNVFDLTVILGIEVRLIVIPNFSMRSILYLEYELRTSITDNVLWDTYHRTGEKKLFQRLMISEAEEYV